MIAVQNVFSRYLFSLGRAGLVTPWVSKITKTKAPLTAAVVASFLLNPDAYLGSADAPGFLERVFGEPVRAVGAVFAGLLAIWGTMKLAFAYRRMKQRAAVR